MPIIERDVALQGVDKDGNPTIDMPITRLGNIEDTAETKETLADKDYIPIIDSEDDGEMKKVKVAVFKQSVADGQTTLTGQPGQIVGFDKDGEAVPFTLTPGPNVTLRQAGSALEIGAVVPGKNLLINWDFRKPVNRNGKTEYTTDWAYTIDRWFLIANSALSIHSGYVSITNGLDQKFEALSPGQYTVSMLTTAGLVTSTVTIAEVSAETYVSLNSIGMLIFVPGGGWRLRIQPGAEYRNLIAAKLELGDHQTLARQNESGEWEIIDPVDYDLQYLLCSQYSPITGEWVGLQHSNDNLLRNWYFPAPINQRNIPSGELWEEYGHGIDGWKAFGGGVTKWVEGEGIYLCAGNTSNAIAEQRIEADRLPDGTTATLSALVNNQLATLTFVVQSGFNSNAVTVIDGATAELQFLTTAPGNGVYTARLWKRDKDYTVKATAAKLELGPVQTLAHKEGDTWVLNDPPPNKAMELLKCQWYYRYLGVRRVPAWEISTDHFSYCVNYDPIMRINPTVRIDADPSKIYLASNKSYDLSGFVFSVDWSVDGAVKIRATKAQHGIPLDDPPLLAIQSNTVELDANL